MAATPRNECSIIVALMGRRALFLAGLLALLLAAGAQATSSFGRRAMARAKADAAAELAAAQLPRGARTVHGDQSVGALLGPPQVLCTKTYVVDKHAFWRVPEQPAAVWSWLKAHPPSQHTSVAADARSGPFLGQVYVGFPVQLGVGSRFLKFRVVAAKGGGSAVRADGVAVWEPHPGSLFCVTGPY